MQETKEPLPSREASYEPEPETVAGFIASMAHRVDELLGTVAHANQFEENIESKP